MASTKPTVEVTGARELNRALAKAAGRAGALKEIHQRLSVPLLMAARGEAPYRTGTLAGSIRASATKRALSLKVGGRAVPYAAPIHYGWRARNIDPNPFLIRARDAMADQVADGYRRHVDQLVEDVVAESLTK